MGRRGRTSGATTHRPDANELARSSKDVICADEGSARRTAQQRQDVERNPEVEWIYLLREWDGRWVARPWHPGMPGSAEPPRRSKADRVTDGIVDGLLELLNPASWF